MPFVGDGKTSVFAQVVEGLEASQRKIDPAELSAAESIEVYSGPGFHRTASGYSVTQVGDMTDIVAIEKGWKRLDLDSRWAKSGKKLAVHQRGFSGVFDGVTTRVRKPDELTYDGSSQTGWSAIEGATLPLTIVRATADPLAVGYCSVVSSSVPGDVIEPLVHTLRSKPAAAGVLSDGRVEVVTGESPHWQVSLDLARSLATIFWNSGWQQVFVLNPKRGYLIEAHKIRSVDVTLKTHDASHMLVSEAKEVGGVWVPSRYVVLPEASAALEATSPGQPVRVTLSDLKLSATPDFFDNPFRSGDFRRGAGVGREYEIYRLDASGQWVREPSPDDKSEMNMIREYGLYVAALALLIVLASAAKKWLGSR